MILYGLYMCWNEDISINTFLFGCLALVFIYFSNTYTRYKTVLFDHPGMYLFTFLVISMQLLEYFLWKYLNNKKINRHLSKVGLGLILSQLLASILLLQVYRVEVFAAFLSLCLAIYLYSRKAPFDFRTTVSNGHLSWNWIYLPGMPVWVEKMIMITILVFYFLPWILLPYPSKWILFPIALFLFVLAYAMGKRDQTYGSLWCWFINGFLLLTLIHILLVQPFREYNGLC